MTGGGVDRSVECTGNVSAMISAFECVHDVNPRNIHCICFFLLSHIRNRKSEVCLPYAVQGWGVAVLVGVPDRDDAFKTHPMNVLNEKTLKGTFFGNYKPRTDLPSVVEMYMSKVNM